METQKRLKIIQKINSFVKNSKLSGLLVSGSIAWGKNVAVYKDSDIDFYLVGRTISDYLGCIDKAQTFLPPEKIETVKKMLTYQGESVDTCSFKTTTDEFHGAIYLFLEENLLKLADLTGRNESIFFKNLRSTNNAQFKEYKSFTDKRFTFETSIRQASDSIDLWIRTDPIVLISQSFFFGSIFIAHLLFGEIYVDKNKVLNNARRIIREMLKSKLCNDIELAYKEFVSYLPRAEKMSKDTIRSFFNEIWRS